MMLDAEIERRFWDKVDKKGADDCWEWTASRLWSGYGRLGVHDKTMSAHRVSYILNIGTIPKGLLVLHSCDNPPCVNPEHLSVGTWKDNMQQKSDRGRCNAPSGERSGQCKLSDEEVIAIIMAKDMTQKQIAAMYGCSQAHVSRLRNGKKRQGISLPDEIGLSYEEFKCTGK